MEKIEIKQNSRRDLKQRKERQEYGNLQKGVRHRISYSTHICSMSWFFSLHERTKALPYTHTHTYIRAVRLER